MNEEVIIKWKPGVKDKITREVPDKIIYDTARTLLDLSFNSIPKRTGKMRMSSLSKGVQGSNSDYYIGSYTDYAKFVYDMPNKTKWTTPGTNSHWFRKYWLEHGKTIFSMVVERNKLK